MSLAWVILTMGNRWPATEAAIASLRQNSPGDQIVLVLNGADRPSELPPDITVVELADNVGAPAGRVHGVAATSSDIVGFLDDDAIVTTSGIGAKVRTIFAEQPDVAVVAMQIVDEHGDITRRHNPRIGFKGVDEPGDVTTFLAGANAMRRAAFETVGGYWGDLFYSHEETDLAWRLLDAGYRIRFEPGLQVCHPKTEISRHGRGWWLTGRNRVMIARRSLPAPVMVVHCLAWLVVGGWRAPNRQCRVDYVKGWFVGWRQPVDRQPMRWATVVGMARLGRPPII